MEIFFTFHKQSAVFLLCRLKYEISPQTTCTVTNKGGGWAAKTVIAESKSVVGIQNCDVMNPKGKRRVKE